MGALVALGLAAVAGAVLGTRPSAHAERLAIPPSPGVIVQEFGTYDTMLNAAVLSAAPAAFAVPVTVPAAARLLTAVAVPNQVWVNDVADKAAPVTFTITFEPADAAATTIYRRTIDIARRREQRRWYEVGRDLSAFAGRTGVLRFSTTVPEGQARTTALWVPPRLQSCDGSDASVMLIVLDALRADHVGAYGYARRTTPHLDALAVTGTTLDAAFSAAPKTLPSIPQLLTGTYFPQHRRTPGLAALFGDRPVSTRAIVNNPYVATWIQAQRPGFDAVVTDTLDARDITTRALRFLTATGNCPSMLYLHYLDTHTPYRPPERFVRRLAGERRGSKVGDSFDDVTGAWNEGYEDPADRARIGALYDAAIAWTDAQLGRLFQGLANRGLADRTIVAVTADHGEELWDHNRFFHGQSLYDELLHVPLIVRAPGVAPGKRVTGIVSTIDILSTLAELAGRPAPPTDGVSFARHVRVDADTVATSPAAGSAAALPEVSRAPVFATVGYVEPRSPPRHAARSTTMKVVRNISDGLIEAYDLTTDPRESRNVGAAASGAGELLALIDAVRRPNAERGYQLELRSSEERPVSYAITITSDPPLPIVEPDRLTLERGERLVADSRNGTLTVGGTLEPGDADRVRFDVLATGSLTVTIQLEGSPAPDGALRLGSEARPAGATIDLGDTALDGAPPTSPSPPSGAPSPVSPSASVSPDAPTARVTAYLWRAGAPAAFAPPLDPVTRNRLRALGYAE